MATTNEAMELTQDARPRGNSRPTTGSQSRRVIATGGLFALLFGIFFDGPNFGGLLLYSVANGGIFGAVLAGIYYVLASDGRRDFVSDTSIVADRNEVHADEGVADEAKRVLSTMPGRS